MKKKAEKPFEPIVIEGEIKFKLTLSEDGYGLESPPSPVNDLVHIMIARNISEGYKVDMGIMKNSPGYKALSTKEKEHFKTRYDKLIHSVKSLEYITGDMVQTAMAMSAKKD
jgi:hypothetical protein